MDAKASKKLTREQKQEQKRIEGEETAKLVAWWRSMIKPTVAGIAKNNTLLSVETTRGTHFTKFAQRNLFGKHRQ